MQAGLLELGTIYVNYDAASKAISSMSEGQARSVVERFQRMFNADLDAHYQASSLMMEEFSDKTHSHRIVRIGRPTLFDRDPKAVQVMDTFLAKIESETNGYAFDDDPDRCTGLVAIAGDVAAIAHDLPDIESFWCVYRALSHNSPFHFSDEHAFDAADLMDEALHDHDVLDNQIDNLRFLARNPFGGRHGFVSVEEFENEVKTNSSERFHVYRAAESWRRQFGQACGPFDFKRSLEQHREGGRADYWSEWSTKSYATADIKEKTTESRPVSKGSQEAYREFAQSEIDNGYSPYGYWFGPDGTVYPMQAFQDHIRWLGEHLGRKTGLLREEAMREGWVSLTMANEFTSDPNIGFNPASDCSQALKAAARIVRRGGDYLAMVVEAYDDNLSTLSYEQFDDLKQGVRRLNELSREVGPNYVAAPKP